LDHRQARVRRLLQVAHRLHRPVGVRPAGRVLVLHPLLSVRERQHGGVLRQLLLDHDVLLPGGRDAAPRGGARHGDDRDAAHPAGHRHPGRPRQVPRRGGRPGGRPALDPPLRLHRVQARTARRRPGGGELHRHAAPRGDVPRGGPVHVGDDEEPDHRAHRRVPPLPGAVPARQPVRARRPDVRPGPAVRLAGVPLRAHGARRDRAPQRHLLPHVHRGAPGPVGAGPRVQEVALAMTTVKPPKRKTAVEAIVTGAAAIATLVLLNVLSCQARSKLDLTEYKVYSLTPSSRGVVANMPEKVNIKPYFGNAPPDKAEKQTYVDMLLQEYAEASGGKITYERLDPYKDTALAEEGRKDG